ncbi:MAG: hypothetical protein QF860_14210, partial [Planctomycetota bacterium]|nr:hypothetical protein [Planctomycetota bacterium]
MARRRVSGILSALVAALAPWWGPVSGAVIHVPADEATIQGGIDAASQGDSVLVAPGVYSGDGNRDIEIGEVGVLLISSAGPESTLINCGGSELDPHRGFSVQGVGVDSVTIDGFTVTAGYAEQVGVEWFGGGMVCHGGRPTIRNCILWANESPGESGHGGGLACVDRASPTLTGC